MYFSKTELGILDQLARGNKDIKIVAEALKKSRRSIYCATSKLQEKGFATLEKGIIKPKEGLHIILLLQSLAKTPDLPKSLSSAKLSLLTAILNPKTLKKIEEDTGIKKSMIYKYLKELSKRNLIRTHEQKYVLNHKMWPKLAETLHEIKRVDELTDKRIPKSSIIYKKAKEEIIFYCKEKLDATTTAFSAYEQYGIKLLLIQNYYTLPKRKLNKKDILTHSIYVAEKEKDIKTKLFLVLFYAKYKKEFSKIHHEILKNINKILKKQKIKGYPSYEEIKDRAKVYNIKI